MKKIPDLTWNVIHYDFNAKKITTRNLLTKSLLEEVVKKLTKEYGKEIPQKEKFAEVLDKEIMYRHWAKCEYEVIVTAWPPDDTVYKKIDWYWQVKLNFDVFCDYVYNALYNNKAHTK